MADIKPTYSRAGSDEGDAFGWKLFHDRQRNLIYYLHSYTGEVRWPRPETVGFVMHGLKPLPANAGGDGMVNPDIWSPYYPHVVMLPSGLMQVHPGPGSETQEMWCGYNRFPLANFEGNTGNGEYGADGTVMMPSGPRMLPPTWEDSRCGSPFLPPYPVTILRRDDMENKRQVAPRPPPQRLDERFQTPEVDAPRNYRQLQSGELGRVQGSMDWSTLTRRNTSAVTSNQVTERKRPAFPKGFPAPNTEKKEHNRKGYLLRQARKMMRDNSSGSVASTPSATTASSTKQRKTQEVPSTAKARQEVSSEMEDKQDNFTAYGDYDRFSLHF